MRAYQVRNEEVKVVALLSGTNIGGTSIALGPIHARTPRNVGDIETFLTSIGYGGKKKKAFA